jgi:BRCT domain type II-containing protein
MALTHVANLWTEHKAKHGSKVSRSPAKAKASKGSPKKAKRSKKTA